MNQELAVETQPQTVVAKKKWTRKALLERGMATAEYAIGVLVVIGFGFLIYKTISSDGVVGMLIKLVGFIFDTLTSFVFPK